MTPDETATLTAPCIVYLCLHCRRQARFTELDYVDMGDDRLESDWQYLTPEVFTRLLTERDWIIDGEGYTFCSADCQSKKEIDIQCQTRRAVNAIRQLLGKGEL